MSVVRSIRLRDDEQEALERLSAEQNVSKNSLLVIAFRALAGLPLPPWAQRLTKELHQ